MSRLHIISILYNSPSEDIERLCRSVAASVAAAHSAGALSFATLTLGNCGDRLSPGTVTALLPQTLDSQLVEFGANLGHSGGCNEAVARLDGLAAGDLLLFLNPDALLAPSALIPLAADLQDPTVGAVDARQIPFEHPKWFDPRTRTQSWASGACLGTRAEVFQAVGGFDSKYFWSYCNDVDLSWRIRLAGYSIRYTPDAVVFHDKRLGPDGNVVPTASEVYYATLGRLHLACRFDNSAVVADTLAWTDRSGTPEHRRAAADFRAAVDRGDIPTPLPHAAAVASFRAGEYGDRRF